MSRPEPTADQAELFARYRRHVEGERELKPDMQAAAAAALQAGVSAGTIAKATGLTPEPFRRMARKLGVDRKRPPTVGKDVPPPAAP
jgi:hypothetical protein